MKRYALFEWEAWYSTGGWHDFRADYDFVEEAVSARDIGYECFHVVDLESGKIVRDE